MTIFDLYHKHYENYLTLIAKCIGYGADDYNDMGNVYDYTEETWARVGDTLHVREGSEDYEYTISSLGAKGDELYMGRDGTRVFIMCHEPDDHAENTFVFVFDRENELEIEDYEEGEF